MSYKWKQVKERNYWQIGAILGAVIIVGLIIAGIAQIDLTGVGIDVDYIGREGYTPPAGAKPVTLKFFAMHKLDRGNPAATPIRLYDANKVFFASASTSTGVATFTGVPVYEGESLFYQARATAPSNTAYVTYMTELIPFTVPQGDLSSIATVGPINLWEVSTSVATYNVTDGSGDIIYTEATQFVNTTESELFVKVSITTDCAFGTPWDFEDHDTGKNYLGGAWLVLKSTGVQDFSNAYTSFYSGALNWYIFRIPMIVRSTANGYETSREFELILGTGSTFVASADFDFDLWDICLLNSGGQIDANSFKNGDSDLNPAALANKVA